MLQVALQNQPMSWITPLGLPVVQPYRRNNALIVKTLLQDVQVRLFLIESLICSLQRSAYCKLPCLFCACLSRAGYRPGRPAACVNHAPEERLPSQLRTLPGLHACVCPELSCVPASLLQSVIIHICVLCSCESVNDV
jgi:hypothetical protein